MKLGDLAEGEGAILVMHASTLMYVCAYVHMYAHTLCTYIPESLGQKAAVELLSDQDLFFSHFKHVNTQTLIINVHNP